jgi:hypothetical protein
MVLLHRFSEDAWLKAFCKQGFVISGCCFTLILTGLRWAGLEAGKR